MARPRPLLLVGALSLGIALAPSAMAQTLRPAAARACDDGLKTSFRPDGLTTVLLVKAFAKGDALLLSGEPKADTPRAAEDICLVKLNVGPGNPGDPRHPSTSAGIGIEVWLPASPRWNGRIHLLGGGGWAGGSHGSTTQIAMQPDPSPAAVAGTEGAVSATTDTGHNDFSHGPANPAGGNGSFGMNPDGSINAVLWRDFAERGITELVRKTKALTRHFYGRDARYTYWDGFSTGGRQALKQAQINPDQFDGILAGAPAINWTRFITGELYPQVVIERDLGAARLAPAQLQAVSLAAIRACDQVGGVHLGYVLDPAQCRYDPTQDTQLLCAADGGRGAAPGCVDRQQARAFNKIWYGQTTDGSVPSPARSNGFDRPLDPGHLWYGPTRGTSLAFLAGASPFTVASDLVAMELGDPRLSTPGFVNATSNGQDGWRNLAFAQLEQAARRGLAYQDGVFARINTDNPDLGRFKRRGGKLLMYHGLADQLIPSQGSVGYYESVLRRMGGLSSVQSFYRLFLIPGMAHAFANGTANTSAKPPLPAHDELYRKLTDWVEKGIAPQDFTATSTDGGRTRSTPICAYPGKITYTSGDPLAATSYTCRRPN